jgi:hypothetical protein
MSEDQTPPQENAMPPNMNPGLAMLGDFPGMVSMVQDYLKETEERHATVMRALADIMGKVRTVENMLKEGSR